MKYEVFTNTSEQTNMNVSKKIKILYWVATGLFAFMMLGSALPDMFSVQIAVEGFNKMKMPVYLLPFLGTAKALGVLAILIPGYPKIKEWAYAGLIFDLLGATWCIFSSGERGGNLASMILPIALGILSYVFYHRKLNAVGSGNVKTFEQEGFTAKGKNISGALA